MIGPARELQSAGRCRSAGGHTNAGAQSPEAWKGPKRIEDRPDADPRGVGRSSFGRPLEGIERRVGLAESDVYLGQKNRRHVSRRGDGRQIVEHGTRRSAVGRTGVRVAQ